MLKVLIVEDEETIRRGIALTIDWGSLNCTVVAEAANGEEGLAAAQRYQPNLIITDIKMPKMDGLEMVRRLRQMGNGAFVIILTAFDTFEYAQNAIRLGAVDYILKPFHDGDLERAVQAVQGRYAGEKAVPSPPESGLKKGDRSKYVQGAVSYVDAHFDDPALSISAIAADLGTSEGASCWARLTTTIRCPTETKIWWPPVQHWQVAFCSSPCSAAQATIPTSGHRWTLAPMCM